MVTALKRWCVHRRALRHREEGELTAIRQNKRGVIRFVSLLIELLRKIDNFWAEWYPPGRFFFRIAADGVLGPGTVPDKLSEALMCATVNGDLPQRALSRRRLRMQIRSESSGGCSASTQTKPERRLLWRNATVGRVLPPASTATVEGNPSWCLFRVNNKVPAEKVVVMKTSPTPGLRCFSVWKT